MHVEHEAQSLIHYPVDRVGLSKWDYQWLHTSANHIYQRCLSMMTLQPVDSAQKQPLKLQARWPPCAGSSSISTTAANCPNSPVTYPAELGQVNSYSLIDSKIGTALGLDTNTPTAQAGAAGGTAGGSVAGTPLTVNGLANGVNNSGTQANTNGQGNGQGSVGAGNGNMNGNGNTGGLNGNGNGIGSVGNGNGSNNGNGNTNSQG